MRIDPARGALIPTTERLGAPAEPGIDLRVAQFNVLNFFDTVDEPHSSDPVTPPAEYQNKLAKLALAIRDTLKGADIITMQEVENQQVLDDLLARPELAELGYKSLLIEGNDRRGIDNAMLYRTERVKLVSHEVATPDNPAGLPPAGGSIDRNKLFARPPLIATFEVKGAAQAVEGAAQITLITNHFKSKLGSTSNEDPRRTEQAKYVAGLVDARRGADLQANVVVLGDLNALPGEDPLKAIAKFANGKVRMYDTPSKVAAAERYTYIYQGKKNLLDHVFVTPELNQRVTKVEIPHINSGQSGNQADPTTPNFVSDHDPVITTFRF